MQSNISSNFQKDISKLSDFEKAVIVDKATERSYSGSLLENKSDGLYTCKLCGVPLYRSGDKFESHCGWPSFDDEISGAVTRVADADGRRVEIVCSNCGAHLGHVFEGEGMTPKNTRHCVNSISMNFEPSNTKTTQPNLEKAYVAGGCFWGVEHYMQELDGVVSAVSGFMGGVLPNPDYYDVVRGDTGHFETVEVTYDPEIISYHDIIKQFFQIHDPEQANGQGPDIGSQYQSAIFVSTDEQAKIVTDLIAKLETNGYKVATQVLATKSFFPADDSHQDYYAKKGSKPYCHSFVKRF